MKNLLIPALAMIGSIFGTMSANFCLVGMFDEPEMPESLN